MKKIFLFAITLFIGLNACNSSTPQQQAPSSSSVQSETQQPAPTLKRVTLETFKEKLASATDAQVIDVRTPREVEKGTIPNAQNINFFDGDFSEQVAKLDKEKPVFLFCKVGGRSSQALKVFKRLGFQEVYELKGGYTAWSNAQ